MLSNARWLLPVRIRRHKDSKVYGILYNTVLNRCLLKAVSVILRTVWQGCCLYERASLRPSSCVPFAIELFYDSVIQRYESLSGLAWRLLGDYKYLGVMNDVATRGVSVVPSFSLLELPTSALSANMPELFKFIEQLKPHIPPSGIPATERDEIWLLDNTAFRSSPNDPWTAEFVSAYFHHNSEARTKISAAISILMHELGYAPDDKETEERIRTRLAPLMRSIASNMTVDVVFEPNHAGGGQLHLGPSDGNGISSQLFTVPVLDPETGKTPLPGTGPITMTVARSELEGAEQKSDTAILETGRLFLAEDGGFGLISDLDDTAKVCKSPNNARN
jgi:hypothetical protein